MTRKLFLLLTLTFLASTIQSATMVTGQIVGSVTWKKEASPYRLQGAINVPVGSTLSIEPGTQVMVEGTSSLNVQGTLTIHGSAANPVVFHMMEGGLNSYVMLSGAKAEIMHAKFLGGAFVARDAEMRIEGCEFAKGSGLYLQGHSAGEVRNNKFYGNAVGLTLDGPVEIEFRFNTVVQNTYGLQIKEFATLICTNNSIHGNQQFEVVNRSGKEAPLGGNYWGVDTWTALKPKVQGKSDFDPLKSLKDVLRAYVKTLLPDLPADKIAEVKKRALKEKEDARLGALAVKKRRAEILRQEKLAAAAKAREVAAAAKEAAAAKKAEEAAAKAAEAPVVEAPVVDVPATDEVPMPEAPVASEPVAAVAPPVVAPKPEPKAETVVMPTAPTGKTSITAMPAVVRTLKPLVLPPAQALPNDIPASAGKSPMAGITEPVPSTAVEPAPVAPAPATAPAVGELALPDFDMNGMALPEGDAGTKSIAPAPAPAAPSAVPDIPGGDAPPPPDFGDFDIPAPAPVPGAAAPAPAVAAPASSVPAPAPPPDFGDLDLPAMGDVNVPPPSDMELPPSDDLGNFKLD